LIRGFLDNEGGDKSWRSQKEIREEERLYKRKR
jgi:hypothetical protein